MKDDNKANNDQALTGRRLYDAICGFESSTAAREVYYSIMSAQVGAGEKKCTVREQILRIYAMLFCEELAPGSLAGPDEVAATADRLYIGEVSFDPDHWYRMKYHFPVIDDDNYDRFAALVISDMKSGPLHDAIKEKGDMLLVGETDPLSMTPKQRKHQSVRSVGL